MLLILGLEHLTVLRQTNLLKLKFRPIGPYGRRKMEPEGSPLSKARTNNKVNPHMAARTWRNIGGRPTIPPCLLRKLPTLSTRLMPVQQISLFGIVSSVSEVKKCLRLACLQKTIFARVQDGAGDRQLCVFRGFFRGKNTLKPPASRLVSDLCC